MKILKRDESTIITLEGFIKPFEIGNGMYRQADPIPTHLLDVEPEMLRQIVSYKLFGGEDTERLVPREKFYQDEWDVTPYKKETLRDFLDSVRKTLRVGTLMETFYLDNGYVVLMGYNRDNREAADATIASPKFWTVTSYMPENEEQRELMKKYLQPGSATALIECLLVGIPYQRRGEKMYDHFRKNTPTKVREIYAPKDDVKLALKHMLLPLNKAYDMKSKDTNQFAYTIGRSIKDNAQVHKNYKYSLKCDIKGFFDHCNWDMVKKYIKFIIPTEVWNDEEAMATLKQMMVNPDTGGVYQGSPTSGAITNAIMKPASSYMMNIFEKEDKVFSIYADDITISSDEPLNRSNVIGKIRHVFEHFNLPFRLHPDKTKMVTNNKRKVTGVRINHKDELTIDRKKYRLLRSILHRMSKNEPITMQENKLMGNIAFFRFIDDSGKITRLLTKYDDVLKNGGIQLNNLPEQVELNHLFAGFAENVTEEDN